MILRMWKGQSNSDNASKYIRHATQTVFPKLQNIDGYRGAYLLRLPLPGSVEFVVLSLWESMDAIKQFAGENADQAVVEPEAQSALSGFDEFVTHYEVVHATGQTE